MYQTRKKILDFVGKDSEISKKDLDAWFTRAGVQCLLADGYITEINEQPTEKGQVIMEKGKYYYLNYGCNTEIIGRYNHSDPCRHHFFDLLHYWNGYENFQENDFCVKSGIEVIREATQAEKFNLFRLEIENKCV